MAVGSPALAAERTLDAKLKQADGERIRLSDLRGESVLLELWATWCLPCHEQSAILHDLQDEVAESGVRAFAVNVGEDADLVRAHLETHPAPFPVLLDRLQTIPAKLRIGELPALILLDAEGRVVDQKVGVVQRDTVMELLHRAAPSGSSR